MIDPAERDGRGLSADGSAVGDGAGRQPLDRQHGNGARPDGHFHLFVYGTLRSDRSRSSMLDGCERVTGATVDGTLYDLDDHPALILYGTSPVRGEVWRCPLDLLWKLDEYEGVDSGLFRRIGLEVAGLPCWLYVAGHALAHRLTPDRRIRSGDWTPTV